MVVDAKGFAFIGEPPLEERHFKKQERHPALLEDSQPIFHKEGILRDMKRWSPLSYIQSFAGAVGFAFIGEPPLEERHFMEQERKPASWMHPHELIHTLGCWVTHCLAGAVGFAFIGEPPLEERHFMEQERKPVSWMHPHVLIHLISHGVVRWVVDAVGFAFIGEPPLEERHFSERERKPVSWMHPQPHSLARLCPVGASL